MKSYKSTPYLSVDQDIIVYDIIERRIGYGRTIAYRENKNISNFYTINVCLESKIYEITHYKSNFSTGS